ncbi:MAG: Flp family type IVb pilin [Pseudobdellovibrionaceae bacterium]
MKLKYHPLNNQKGQTLIEYLIIVALVGVGSIALMRTVSIQINSKFAHVVESLGGTVTGKIGNGRVHADSLKNIDMRNFEKKALKGKDDANNGEAGD